VGQGSSPHLKNAPSPKMVIIRAAMGRGPEPGRSQTRLGAAVKRAGGASRQLFSVRGRHTGCSPVLAAGDNRARGCPGGRRATENRPPPSGAVRAPVGAARAPSRRRDRDRTLRLARPSLGALSESFDGGAGPQLSRLAGCWPIRRAGPEGQRDAHARPAFAGEMRAQRPGLPPFPASAGPFLVKAPEAAGQISGLDFARRVGPRRLKAPVQGANWRGRGDRRGPCARARAGALLPAQAKAKPSRRALFVAGVRLLFRPRGPGEARARGLSSAGEHFGRPSSASKPHGRAAPPSLDWRMSRSPASAAEAMGGRGALKSLFSHQRHCRHGHPARAGQAADALGRAIRTTARGDHWPAGPDVLVIIDSP